MAWAFINGLAQDFSTSPSGAIDTTGCDLIVISLSLYSGNISGRVMTDSVGNTYTQAAYADSGNYHNALYYCQGPVTNSSHTFSCNDNSNALSLTVACYSGSDPSGLDQLVIGSGSGGSTYQAGSITPSVNSELIICSIACAATVGVIDSGFTVDEFEGNSGGGVGNGLARLFQSTAGAVNPTWTTAGFDNIGINASFKASTGPTPLTLSVNDSLSLSDAFKGLVSNFLAVNDSLSFTDAVNLFSAALQFNDGFFLVDSVKLNLNIPLSVSDTLSLSDSLAWMFLGPFLGFTLGDSFALSDSVALSHGISLSVSDAISLSDATLRSVFYNLQFVDTLNLTDSMGFNALMLGKIKEVDVLSLTDSIKLALTGSKSIQDTITLSDTVRIIMTGLASFADTLSLSDAVTRTVNSNDLVSDALALSDSVQLQLNVVPSNSYVDILTLSDAVVVELYYFPPQLFIDTLQFTDSVNLVLETLGQFTDMLWFTDDVQLSLNVSTTSYLRLYLNDVIGSGNP